MAFFRSEKKKVPVLMEAAKPVPLMIWREQFSTHIPSIDRQHKVLIKYINDLHESAKKEDSSLEMAHILGGLISYTKIHFAYEEMLFRTYNYAETEEHLNSHQRLIEKIAWYKKRFDKKESNVTNELLDLLKYWLNHHILQEDMAYSRYLISKGAH